jgi:hypothetical protein
MRTSQKLSYACCAAGLIANLAASHPSFAADADSASTTVQSGSEVEKLKAQLAAQQVQLDQLRSALDEQKKLIDGMFHASDAPKTKSLGEVASLAPMIPAAPAIGTPDPKAMPTSTNDVMHQTASADVSSPLSLKIGNSYLTPVGFMDFTSVNRSTVGGGGIGSNFGSIPYNTSALEHLSEFRLSTQNSRIGFRFDSLFHDTKVLGYFEGDFLGNNPGNVAVSSNSDTFRLRLYFVDLQKNKMELTAGESWSLMTPGRSGISPLPGNIFFSNDIDVNYQAGLVWTRAPGIRFAYHASDKLHFAIAAENAEQYVGGSAGAGVTVPPTALATTVFTQFNNANSTLSTPNFMPDIIGKVAWDPSKRFHLEVAGMVRTFKDYNQAINQHFMKTGRGGSLNANFEIIPGLRIVTMNYWSDGGGRYIFGQAPDLVLKANGDIGLLHAGSTVTGFEETYKNTLFYGYYGGILIGRYSVIDPTNGKPVGYGYSGAANSQNKAVQEGTIGFNQTLWKDAKWGAVNFMGQYSYLTRNPWYLAVNTPKNTHQNQIYLNLRYTLPGSAPALK